MAGAGRRLGACGVTLAPPCLTGAYRFRISCFEKVSPACSRRRPCIAKIEARSEANPARLVMIYPWAKAHKRLSPTGKRIMFMKKLMVALICGLVLAVVSAWGQTWIKPYTDKDGTQVEGHWQTPEDLRKDRYSTPGKINPYTGQFNPYTGSSPGPQLLRLQPPEPRPLQPQSPPGQNPYYPQPDYRYKGR